MQPDAMIWAIMLSVFGAVVGVTVIAGSYFSQRGAVRQRLAGISSGAAHPADPGARRTSLASMVETLKAKFDRKTPIDPAERGRQRLEMMKAGWFGPQAVSTYRASRIIVTIGLPIFAYLYITLFAGQLSTLVKFLTIATALVMGYYIPEAYLKRRQGGLQEKYRLDFPDILDTMVVCVDAGLSLNAALERVGTQMQTTHRELGTNFAMMSSEMRAGRGTMEALQGFADRLGIEEARSLALLLQQSIELGTDVSQALRTFSDEMRDKRMSRAEERAAALPVKLVMPMGAFIFPVILIVILTPILLKIARGFSKMT